MKLFNRLWILLLSTIAGIVLSVAFAWYCANASSMDDTTQTYPLAGPLPPAVLSLIPPGWLTHTPDAPPTDCAHRHGRGLGVEAHEVRILAPQPTGGPKVLRQLNVQRAGWPFVSLECDQTSGQGTGAAPGWAAGGGAMQWQDAYHQTAGLQRGSRSWHYAAAPDPIPLRPMWPGFALNTILFGAASWLLVTGPFKARRALRRRRGLCLSCQYPVRGLARCPECGKPVIPERQET